MRWEITNGKIVTPERVIDGGSIHIYDEKIKTVSSGSNGLSYEVQIDLNGLLVFPRSNQLS